MYIENDRTIFLIPNKSEIIIVRFDIGLAR
jgi:hypothetical protein